ncbi:hypothetical protein ACUH92_08785 [Dermabacteraceae bacterium CCM 9520]
MLATQGTALAEDSDGKVSVGSYRDNNSAAVTLTARETPKQRKAKERIQQDKAWKKWVTNHNKKYSHTTGTAAPAAPVKPLPKTVQDGSDGFKVIPIGVDEQRAPVAHFDGTLPTPDPKAPEQPKAPVEPQVSSRELAIQATKNMGIELPQITSLPNDSSRLGYIGLPVWMWIENPGPTTTGPQTATATAGATSVTATARYVNMTVKAGDGTTFYCKGPGTRYPGKGIEPSPDCGHTYSRMSTHQPDGLYHMQITVRWLVTWESTTGEKGRFYIDLPTEKTLKIGQLQTVVTEVKRG